MESHDLFSASRLAPPLPLPLARELYVDDAPGANKFLAYSCHSITYRSFEQQFLRAPDARFVALCLGLVTDADVETGNCAVAVCRA